MQYNRLSNQRILSIDALRGITILVMIFVNELAGMRDIPQWMKHMPADADAMTFVDVVFPGFLFIVGMSLPFAINSRLAKGSTLLQLQAHILFRSLGLLVLGFFMVNAEEGLDAAATGLPLDLWALLFYAAVIMIWKVYAKTGTTTIYLLKATGAVILVALAIIYRGPNGEAISPHWWGILGLIGWAYLFACILYQLCRGNIWLLILCTALCTAWYAAAQAGTLITPVVNDILQAQAGNAAHTSIVLCGCVVSLLFFDASTTRATGQRFLQATVFTVAVVIAGYLMRPLFGISKIHATPSWCYYSVAICTLLFMLVYWFTDIRDSKGWTRFFRPAASNPLLAYIIPNIVYHITALAGISIWPDALRYGIPGIVFSLLYALAVLGIVHLLNKIPLRLQL